MNGVDYSASIMVRIVHATFCTCAFIRKNEIWREVAATKRSLQTTKGQGNGGRQGEVYAYVAICNSLND